MGIFLVRRGKNFAMKLPVKLTWHFRLTREFIRFHLTWVKTQQNAFIRSTNDLLASLLFHTISLLSTFILIWQAAKADNTNQNFRQHFGVFRLKKISQLFFPPESSFLIEILILPLSLTCQKSM